MHKINNSKVLSKIILLILFLNNNQIFSSEASVENSQKEDNASLWEGVKSASQFALNTCVNWAKTAAVITNKRIQRLDNVLSSNNEDISEAEKRVIKKYELMNALCREWEKRIDNCNKEMNQYQDKIDVLKDIERGLKLLEEMAQNKKIIEMRDFIASLPCEAVDKFLEKYTDQEAKVAAIKKEADAAIVLLKEENQKMQKQIRMTNSLLYGTMFVVGACGLYKAISYYFFSGDNVEYDEDKKQYNNQN